MTHTDRRKSEFYRLVSVLYSGKPEEVKREFKSFLGPEITEELTAKFGDDFPSVNPPFLVLLVLIGDVSKENYLEAMRKAPSDSEVVVSVKGVDSLIRQLVKDCKPFFFEENK